MSEEGILFLHLAGVLLFVGGSIAAAVLRVAAMRRERPSEIALLLRAVRPAVPIVALGLLLAIATGFWLVARLELDLGATWLTLTFALLAWVVVVGRSGRAWRPSHARAGGAPRSRRRLTPSVDLARRLRDPVNLALNTSLLLSIAAIVALMVWKPGL